MKILTKLHEKFPKHIPTMTDWVWEQQKEIARIDREMRRQRRTDMWNKITDAIRTALGAVIGMNGYIIINDSDYAETCAELQRLQAQKVLLETQVSSLKRQKAKEFLKDYEYAILVGKQNVTPTLWNNGRFETGIRTMTFLACPGSVPELTIKK